MGEKFQIGDEEIDASGLRLVTSLGEQEVAQDSWETQVELRFKSGTRHIYALPYQGTDRFVNPEIEYSRAEAIDDATMSGRPTEVMRKLTDLVPGGSWRFVSPGGTMASRIAKAYLYRKAVEAVMQSKSY